MSSPKGELSISDIVDAALVTASSNDELTTDRLRTIMGASQVAGSVEADFGLDGEDEGGPSDALDATASEADIAWCAGLDHSDTDNGRRLLRHRGADLAHMLEIGTDKASWAVWTGKFWDAAGGNFPALAVAQTVGGLIAREAEYLQSTPAELAAIRSAADEPTDDSVKGKREALAALERRRSKRRAFGVSSKNSARLEAMLKCAAPHAIVQPDAWNADARLVYVGNGVLRFIREEDPDRSGEVAVYKGRTAFTPSGWKREDRFTRILPVDYDPAAQCPKFSAFVARFLPEAIVPGVAKAVQIYCGLGLTGIPVQLLFFHYGLGANGKSVFLEVLARVLGSLAEGLPAESITGQTQGAAGSASPDLARLPGVRFLRITELPKDEPLREALVKRLTGGEKMDVRTLFKGYFSFQPQFKAHLAGNNYPSIAGSDTGIWRRMAVVPWKITIPAEEQRDFEEVVQELYAEAPGILNWLVEGMLLYDSEGLRLPPAMVQAAKDYRDEMDPITLFIEQCVRPVDPSDGAQLRAKYAYEGYSAWSEEQSKPPKSNTAFGRVMGARFAHRHSEGGKIYLDVRLAEIPVRSPRNPAEGPSDGGEHGD